MKGYTFYLEYPSKQDKRKKRGNPTVLVAYGKPFLSGQSGKIACVETVSAAIEGDRNLFTSGAASLDYIRENCTRVSEAKARSIHPEIFNCGLI